tara:strand:+ start:405 stop:803 length:399 start_codon:yes stop_codon:yes gene_type:complete
VMAEITVLEGLTQSWIDAKERERLHAGVRRQLEDKILSLVGVSENMEGTESVDTDGGYKIKITGRLNRKVNAERVQEIAAEEGLAEHLSSLFRWKPEVNLSAWKSADKVITAPFLDGITTTPGRASFSVTKD